MPIPPTPPPRTCSPIRTRTRSRMCTPTPTQTPTCTRTRTRRSKARTALLSLQGTGEGRRRQGWGRDFQGAGGMVGRKEKEKRRAAAVPAGAYEAAASGPGSGLSKLEPGLEARRTNGLGLARLGLSGARLGLSRGLGRAVPITTCGGYVLLTPVRDHGTALLAASYDGNVEVIRLILEHGANTNPKGGERLRVRHPLPTQARALVGLGSGPASEFDEPNPALLGPA
ncbi:hypothetical protein JB92DRAFT_3113748 [Gautieria morchelliformis]|nr:hypothetical protein JB92DRAFT_3113748 [Gautieria morchelliformis]